MNLRRRTYGLLLTAFACCCRPALAISTQLPTYFAQRRATPAFISTVLVSCQTNNRRATCPTLVSQLSCQLPSFGILEHGSVSVGTKASARVGLKGERQAALRTVLAVAPGSSSAPPLGRSVGIDLGTTNSAVAALVDGKPIIIRYWSHPVSHLHAVVSNVKIADGVERWQEQNGCIHHAICRVI